MCRKKRVLRAKDGRSMELVDFPSKNLVDVASFLIEISLDSYHLIAESAVCIAHGAALKLVGEGAYPPK